MVASSQVSGLSRLLDRNAVIATRTFTFSSKDLHKQIEARKQIVVGATANPLVQANKEQQLAKYKSKTNLERIIPDINSRQEMTTLSILISQCISYGYVSKSKGRKLLLSLSKLVMQYRSDVCITCKERMY